MSMNELTKDELNNLNRDLTGLGELLYGLSDSVDRSGIINEGSLMGIAVHGFSAMSTSYKTTQ